MLIDLEDFDAGYSNGQDSVMARCDCLRNLIPRVLKNDDGVCDECASERGEA